MYKIKNIILVFCAVIIISSCNSYPNLKKLNTLEPVGSPFLRHLTYEYRDLANELKRFSIRNLTTKYLVEKALVAAEGIIVMPEKIGNWDINNGDIVEITTARIDLINTLNNGGRDQAPYQAAVAQSLFDCWALGYKKQVIIRKSKGKISCKILFIKAIKKLKNKMSINSPKSIPEPINNNITVESLPDNIPIVPDPVASEVKEVKGALAPVNNAMFIVFFDWDKFQLSKSSLKVIDAITQELKIRKNINKIIITGYADTSGESKYNNNLSIKRAISVGNAIIAKGLDRELIKAEGRGETDLLVKTPDNTREPSNRRVEITLE